MMFAPSPPSLPHRIEGLTAAILKDHRETLIGLVASLGSPLHLVFPDEMKSRVCEFQQIYENNQLAGQIFYAAKANKSQSFLHAAASSRIGADTSSVEEFTAALCAGIPGYRIMVTGPRKVARLLELAVVHDASIAIDSIGELVAVRTLLLRAPASAARLFLRYKPEKYVSSRFGMDRNEILAALELVADGSLGNFCGFSFHLPGYDFRDRASAAFDCCELSSRAQALGLTVSAIDLGGGWPINYVSAEDWQIFQATISQNDYHQGRAPASTYPYHGMTGDDAFERCLNETRNGAKLTDTLKDLNIAVFIEPGRALLNQAGISLFKVIDYRTIASCNQQYGLTTIEGMSFSLSEQWFQSEFLPDPLLIAATERPEEPVRTAIAGSSCLDSDMLTWRKIEFGCAPSPGELVGYLNTAGYQMDSNESPFHGKAIPTKIALWRKGSSLCWCLDDQYGTQESNSN